jgi:arginase
MKTIRLLYPDYLSGGLPIYHFGANLLQHILPQNTNQPLIKVDIAPPDGKEKEVVDGIYARADVIAGVKDATDKICQENPDKIITIGGTCFVSLAPFDYLKGRYKNVGVIWIDAHPDVSTPKDGYPMAHAMVLGALLGNGDAELLSLVKNKKFRADEVLYVGLQGLHDCQKAFLDEAGVDYEVQNDKFISNEKIENFIAKFDQILVHFDIDVLDEKFFHSTYFTDPDAGGDGSGGGKMKFDQLSEILSLISQKADVVGFSISEYMPFDAYKMHQMFNKVKIFTE